MARQERHCKRLFVLCILLFVSLLATNAGWLWYESQFTEEVTTVTQDVDTGEGSAVVAGIGDAYGTSETDSDR